MVNKIKKYVKYGISLIMLGVSAFWNYEISKPKWREVEIKIGPTNEHYVIVESGIKEGDQVLLRDPTKPYEKIEAGKNIESKMKEVPLVNY